MNKHTTPSAGNKSREYPVPSKETIKRNSEKANAEQAKKPLKAKRVERNFSKDQE